MSSLETIQYVIDGVTHSTTTLNTNDSESTSSVSASLLLSTLSSLMDSSVYLTTLMGDYVDSYNNQKDTTESNLGKKDANASSW